MTKPVESNVSDGSVHDIVDFTEVNEAWRCPELSSDTGGAGQEFFHEGTVVRLDGADHARRRRAMGALLKQRGHKQFRDTALIPTAETLLTEVLRSPDPDGFARMNLMRWGLRVNFRLGAALVGFDEGRAGAGAEELLTLMETLLRGRPSNIAVSTGRFDAENQELKEAIEARNEILERYYTPALARRQAIVEKVRSGQAPPDALPLDLLALIASGTDPAWSDPAVAEREALFLFNAGVHTTTVSLYWTLRELFAWWEAHPDERAGIQDDDYLLSAAKEAMRLHPVTPGFSRRAVADVTLNRGSVISEGELVAIRSGPANLDAEVFGPDSTSFNPHRVVAAPTRGYGFAFGAGPHLCYGLPVVMGAQGIDGSLAYLLSRLLRAGLEPDPAGPLQAPVENCRGGWAPEPEKYVVRFAVGTN